MQLRKKTTLFMVLLSIAICIFAVPCPTKAKDTSIVRVGYYEDGDYMYQNAAGEYEGYNFEYLYEASKLSGLRYEIVDTGSWQNALQMLIDGEIDVLPAVYKTEERTKQMLFTEQPMCNVYTTLNVRKDDIRYDYEDFAEFQGMRVGIIRDGEDGENFKRYCQEHSVTVDIVEYDETSDLLAALEDGTLDGVAITHLGKNSHFRSVAQFSPSPLYIAVSKQRKATLDALNKANNEILLRNPSYLMDLYDKYLSESITQTPVFTKEELSYIQQSTTIRAAYDPSFAPLAYKQETGEFKGAIADMFQLISDSSGLAFSYQDYAQDEALEQLKQGNLDVMCLVDSDYLWDERNDMNSTLYYLRVPTVLIKNSEEEDVETIALPVGYRISETIAKNNQDKEILYVSSVQECLDAVLSGKAQATYANTYVVNHLLNNATYGSLQSTTLTQYANEYCIGVSKSADPRLFSIIDKCIQHMASSQIDELVLQNTKTITSISIEDFVREHIWLVTGLVAAVLSSIIMLLCVNLRNAARSNRRIQDLLYRDDLTGLDNLNRFYVKAEELLKQQTTTSYAFIYCDIDRFKLINDTYGFEEGDLLLNECGKILQQQSKDFECCARISADNFILLLAYQEWDDVVERLLHIERALNDWRKEHAVIPYEIDLSFGAYQVLQQEQLDVQRMLDLANYARHHAKQDTGSPVVLYDEKMREKELLEQDLEGRLDLALEHREFEVYYQPKVHMASNKMIGSEALIRWNHPEYGLLMPGAFIPFFERKGVVVQVDFYLYETVCRTIRSWLDKGLHVAPISCNFSQLHFGHLDFVNKLTTIADKWNTPHELLEIEITESAIAQVSESVSATILELRKLNFMIAIDDFGSGYSSLGQLQKLRADVLKLDRSFVKDGLKEKREQTVIENLVNMVNELGMSVICEGVETKEQASVLQELGCHFAQGFYYYRPMPSDAFERLMQQYNESEELPIE